MMLKKKILSSFQIYDFKDKLNGNTPESSYLDFEMLH